MGNRKGAPREVEERHRHLLAATAADLDEKRQAAWESELRQRAAIRNAFEDGVTVTPIREETGLSTPRLYQIKNGQDDEQPPLYQPRAAEPA
jgi:hypothetical protein